ncbi:MAG: hypothetical protein M3383_03805 [Actinomycetota bacterium]|nr:hypothetical protein [Actinomycetota bacterium]
MRYAAGLARGSACGCVPLIGAPSDRSGGATITLALDELWVEMTAQPALGVELIAPQSPNGVSGPQGEAQGPPGAMKAAARQILAGREDLAGAGFRLELAGSEIPPDVGLGESTAMALAALEALDRLFGIGLAREQMPPLVLACLTDQPGVPTTLRDPVAQAEGGLTFMDFDADGSGGGRYEPLDPALLPPLSVAWPESEAAGAAGVTGGAGDAGDASVAGAAGVAGALADETPADATPPPPSVEKRPGMGRLSTFGADATAQPELPPEALAELGGLAQRALSPLLIGDGAGFGVLLERDRELRERAEPPNPLAQTVAELGVAVNSTGPHGAIVGLFRDEPQLDQIREALTAQGADLHIVRPP